jgi:chemotaxis methyl-accepting protein methylase
MTVPQKACRIDRSEFFRHRSDFDILRGYLNERIGLSTNVLCVGVGHLEEPLSIAAVGKQVLSDNGSDAKLSERLSLDFVESRPIEEISPNYSLGFSYGAVGGAFVDRDAIAKLPKTPISPGYVKDFPAAFELRDGQYHFDNEVVAVVQEWMKNGKFSTKLQNFLHEHSSTYDVVFCNNVIQHLGANGGRVAEGLTKKLLDKNGLVFLHIAGSSTDTNSVLGTSNLIRNNPRFSHLKRIGPAVYKRIP